MPKFSNTSQQRLNTCYAYLQHLFTEAVKHFDCSILCSERSEEEKNETFRTDRSKLKYPQSKHNGSPSLAVDVAPYPIDWNNKQRFHYFVGVVKGITTQMDIPLRWGGDYDLKDQTFFNLPHFEIRG